MMKSFNKNNKLINTFQLNTKMNTIIRSKPDLVILQMKLQMGKNYHSLK